VSAQPALASRRLTPSLSAVRASGMVRVGLPLAGLVALTLFLRTREFDAGFWIDEGLSVGIASHSLADIPGVLRQDGSPPLYYLLLHGWIALVGTGEGATHALSLIFAALTVPAALWAGRTLFGVRAGWTCAAVAALVPFLTSYAQETRMYTLMVALSLVAATALAHTFVHRRRGYLPVFVATLTAMLYTHNWGLFFAVAAFTATAVCVWRSDDRRPLVRDGAIAFGAVGLLFAPWLPTLLFQIRHTGAPWATRPSLQDALTDLAALAGGEGPSIAVFLAGGAGLAAIIGRRAGVERSTALVLLGLFGGTVALAWLSSQASPAWTLRYLAAIVGPLILLAGLGLARAGRLGLVALALVAALWIPFHAPERKSNVREVAETASRTLLPGDLVISTHPEQVPVIAHYSRAGLGYATPLGSVPDTGVMDWRDALERLRATRPSGTLTPLLDRLPAGRRLLLVRPFVGNRGAWKAPWTRLVRLRSGQWGRAIANDDRFELVTTISAGAGPRGVRAVLYTKVRNG